MLVIRTLLSFSGKSILTSPFSLSQVHFKAEEAVFEKFGYEETEEHKEEHKKFIQQIADFQKGFEEGKIPMTMDIITFLEGWLFSHIMGTDQNYSEFFKENGIS